MHFSRQTDAVSKVAQVMHHAFDIGIRCFVVAEGAIPLRHQPGVEFRPGRRTYRLRNKHVFKPDAALG